MIEEKILRNFTIKSTLGDNVGQIELHPPVTKHWYDFLYPGIKPFVVLTGSRALDCYTINDKKIINRSPNDWDFEISQKDFDKLCYDGIINTGHVSII